VGAGVEWAFAPGWTVRLEYQYIGLSGLSVADGQHHNGGGGAGGGVLVAVVLVAVVRAAVVRARWCRHCRPQHRVGYVQCEQYERADSNAGRQLPVQLESCTDSPDRDQILILQLARQKGARCLAGHQRNRSRTRTREHRESLGPAESTDYPSDRLEP
jgi:hypothetical protein